MNLSWVKLFCVFFTLFCVAVAKRGQKPIALDEGTWKELLEGEWMVKFYAPWCPACRGMETAWDAVAGWGDDLEVRVADIDVTTNPGLSGRFLVTALPTIYHVKDGVFRQYLGSRDENSIISFVDDKKWQELEPLSFWVAPTSPHMSLLGFFFKASMHIRTLHNSMTEEYGIPVWCSYLIFALLTIFVGLLLGLVIVCCCDCIYPPQPYQRPHPRQYQLPPGRRQPQVPPGHVDKDPQDIDESDVIEDDRPPQKDDTSEEAAKDSSKDSSGSVRKRQPVAKAD